MGSHVAVGANSSTSLIPQRFFICANRSIYNCIYQYGDTYSKTLLSSYMCSKTYAQVDFFIYIRMCASHPIQVSSPYIALQCPQQHVHSHTQKPCTICYRPLLGLAKNNKFHNHTQLMEEADFYLISSYQTHPNVTDQLVTSRWPTVGLLSLLIECYRPEYSSNLIVKIHPMLRN